MRTEKYKPMVLALAFDAMYELANEVVEFVGVAVLPAISDVSYNVFVYCRAFGKEEKGDTQLLLEK